MSIFALSSCSNFLNGSPLKENLNDQLLYQAAEEFSVKFECDSLAGSISPSGPYNVKKDFPVEVSFSKSSDFDKNYVFDKWVCVDGDGKVRNDCIQVYNYTENSTVTFIKNEPNLVLKPVFFSRPKVTLIYPREDKESSKFDSITIFFNHPVNKDYFVKDYSAYGEPDELNTECIRVSAYKEYITGDGIVPERTSYSDKYQCYFNDSHTVLSLRLKSESDTPSTGDRILVEISDKAIDEEGVHFTSQSDITSDDDFSTVWSSIYTIADIEDNISPEIYTIWGESEYTDPYFGTELAKSYTDEGKTKIPFSTNSGENSTTTILNTWYRARTSYTIKLRAKDIVGDDSSTKPKSETELSVKNISVKLFCMGNSSGYILMYEKTFPYLVYGTSEYCEIPIDLSTLPDGIYRTELTACDYNNNTTGTLYSYFVKDNKITVSDSNDNLMNKFNDLTITGSNESITVKVSFPMVIREKPQDSYISEYYEYFLAHIQLFDSDKILEERSFTHINKNNNPPAPAAGTIESVFTGLKNDKTYKIKFWYSDLLGNTNDSVTREFECTPSAE